MTSDFRKVLTPIQIRKILEPIRLGLLDADTRFTIKDPKTNEVLLIATGEEILQKLGPKWQEFINRRPDDTASCSETDKQRSASPNSARSAGLKPPTSLAWLPPEGDGDVAISPLSLTAIPELRTPTVSESSPVGTPDRQRTRKNPTAAGPVANKRISLTAKDSERRPSAERPSLTHKSSIGQVQSIGGADRRSRKVAPSITVTNSSVRLRPPTPNQDVERGSTAEKCRSATPGGATNGATTTTQRAGTSMAVKTVMVVLIIGVTVLLAGLFAYAVATFVENES